MTVGAEDGRLLTTGEAAALLNLHINTVKRLGDRGDLPYYTVVARGDRRYRLADVLGLAQRAGADGPDRGLAVLDEVRAAADRRLGRGNAFQAVLAGILDEVRRAHGG